MPSFPKSCFPQLFHAQYQLNNSIWHSQQMAHHRGDISVQNPSVDASGTHDAHAPRTQTCGSTATVVPVHPAAPSTLLTASSIDVSAIDPDASQSRLSDGSPANFVTVPVDSSAIHCDDSPLETIPECEDDSDPDCVRLYHDLLAT